MHCSRSADPPFTARTHTGSRLTATVLFLFATAAWAGGFEVRDAQAVRQGDMYLLRADIDIALSEDAREALDSGVPLTVIVEMKVLRKRDLLWDKRMAYHKSTFQLHVHPLSSQYVLKDLASGLKRTFRNIENALQALGTLSDLPLIEAQRLQPGERHTFELRARLDVEALPAPLRPLAYLTTPWRLSSKWYAWPLEP